MSCYRFIAAHAARHPVALSCRVLGVARSGYYAWRRRSPSVRAQADERLKERIRTIHQASRGTYGSPRIHVELREDGEPCGRRRVARLMRAVGLRGGHGRRRHARTTTRDRQAAPAPNRVERAFAPPAIGAPDRLWVADISYVATADGWLYLAVVLDAFSRRVVGWATADHLRAELVIEALNMALRRRKPQAGLIHHSDHGCQYTALAFGQRLQENGLVASMGTVGDCFDNAVAESFFATLKVELLYRRAWPTRAAARLAIFAFIEVWYNRQRRHSTLGYATPSEYEALAREADVA
jgi:putative transposase